MGLPAKPDFLGRGWSFPPSFSKASGVALVSDAEDIAQSLTILLSTAQGERVMLPTYGCDLWRYVFREIGTGLLSELRDVVATAVSRWEPRIRLITVDVRVNRDQPGLVEIDVHYLIRTINTRSNLVFPFYLAEATLLEG